MPSSDALAALLGAHGATLLEVARASIGHGLSLQRPLALAAADFHEDLRVNGASFVTLKRRGDLRGCVGTCTAWRALIEDVAANAYSAAFEDHRFRPLTSPESKGLDISVSVLSAAERIACRSEAELVAALRPGIDGVILEDGRKRGLFLPAVWSMVPDAKTFVAELKRKAGLPADHWSDGMVAQRFTAMSVSLSGRTEA